MRVRIHIYPFFAILLLVIFSQTSYAQPGFKVDIKKEKPYEERKLKAEKTGDGKLKTPKRLYQNLTTRYNYYFNANNKLNEVIERAKEQHRDDFSQLLPFYNYSLDVTAADSLQLDSVIYKCRTGIVNHDLRNEWIDELYLLWATSWHMQKKLDSASMMLQFINYAYAPQDEYGFYTYIGTRKEGAQELSIATKEEKKFLHSNTFSRNNAFIWQIRTLTELGNYTSSGSLITTLKRDPVFPKRLDHALAEAEAYWYYKQQRWDSAAHYLIQALDGAPNKKERARWEYLIAQMLEKTGKPEGASQYYAEAISTTSDPILEVYGRLNLVRINKDGGENAIDKNVAELLKMARRDKYEDYRDIIYYMAAQMEMERNNIAAAQELLMKGAKYNNGNLASRNKAFLQIADVSFDQKKYVQAAAFYDSVQVNEITEQEAQRVFQRKAPLQVVAQNIQVVQRQDSLQRIAAMPEEEREDYIKDLVKQLRKQQGLKEEAAPTAGNQFASGQTAPELFSSGSKGEWYFYNDNSKKQGANEFRQVWGNRPNADNWRRFAVVSQQITKRDGADIRTGQLTGQKEPLTVVDDLTVEGLSARLPLTPEAHTTSNDSIRNALFSLGIVYQNDLEDYPSAIDAFEEIRRRFPDAARMDEVLFNLYYSYTKAGNTAKAAEIKRLLQEKFPNSRQTSIVTTGKDPEAKIKENPAATKAYENVYNLFIEGQFEEALAAKKLADSTYQTTFWQPQLLYIEAVYHIRQREDSIAKKSLQTIISQNSDERMTDKAQTLLNVLSRRQQIEDELNRYQMQNQPETDTTSVAIAPVQRPAVTVQQPPVQRDTMTAKPPVQKPVADTIVKTTPPVKKDTIASKPVVKPADTIAKKPVEKPKVDTVAKKPVPPKSNSIYTYTPETAHYAVMVLDKVDPVFVGEARNAFFRYNRERYSKEALELEQVSLTNDIKLLLIKGFPTAQAATDYAQRAKAVAPTDIIPWLKGNKYTFTIISSPNLDILKGNTDMGGYKKFLEQHLPGKF